MMIYIFKNLTNEWATTIDIQIIASMSLSKDHRDNPASNYMSVRGFQSVFIRGFQSVLQTLIETCIFPVKWIWLFSWYREQQTEILNILEAAQDSLLNSVIKNQRGYL